MVVSDSGSWGPCTSCICFKVNSVVTCISVSLGAHGATDVTGFGILGHARNLASCQKAPVSFNIHTLPSKSNPNMQITCPD